MICKFYLTQQQYNKFHDGIQIQLTHEQIRGEEIHGGIEIEINFHDDKLKKLCSASRRNAGIRISEADLYMEGSGFNLGKTLNKVARQAKNVVNHAEDQVDDLTGGKISRGTRKFFNGVANDLKRSNTKRIIGQVAKNALNMAGYGELVTGLGVKSDLKKLKKTITKIAKSKVVKKIFNNERVQGLIKEGLDHGGHQAANRFNESDTGKRMLANENVKAILANENVRGLARDTFDESRHQLNNHVSSDYYNSLGHNYLNQAESVSGLGVKRRQPRRILKGGSFLPLN